MAKTPQETKTWNLDDIVSLDDYKVLYERAKSLIDELKTFFDNVMRPDMLAKDFVKFLELDETTSECLHRLDARVSLMESTNTKDPVALKLKSQLKDLFLYASEETTVINHWLQGKAIDGKEVLDVQNATRLFATNPEFTYVLQYSRDLSRYSLDIESENIINAKNSNGISVVNDLRDIITTEFRFEFQPKGQKKKTIETQSELSAYMYSADPTERAEAYIARSKEYDKNIEKLFVIYQAVVKDWDYTAKLRGYPTPISMRNAANHVPDQAITTLMKVCTENREVFQRYFKYKAKLLGIPKLSRYDLYAPVGVDSVDITYEKAVDLVLETYESFSSNFAEKAKQIVLKNHIDSHPSPTKRGGAFCLTVTPSIDPYVLLNYSGKGRDISTIAHELGHGVHSMYANKHSLSTQHPTLPLAETASTFGEMILFEKLIDNASSIEQKRFLLTDKIADSYASIMRQNYFVKFEIEAHDKLQKGITEEELSKIWIDGLREQFGESVEVPEMFAREWAFIPHIHHTPFYCYAYNFGELLSLALYKRYKDEGKSFVPKIEQILSAGGSESPEKILAEIGVDINSEQFWQDSFKIIEDWQDQLEKL